MATFGKTLLQTAVLPVRSLIRKEGALKLHGEVLLALDTLRKNPLRSGLTILGIVIGITTVITVSAMINGLNDNVLAGIRTGLGHHHRLPLPLGFALTASKRMVHAKGIAAGMGRGL